MSHFFLSYFHFIVVLNTVMNKVLVQTLSNHGGAPVKMLRSSKIHKNATFQLWEEHRYVFKVQHTNYERSDCRTKAKLPKYSISERELRWLCPELPFPQQPLTKYAKTGAKNVLKYTAKTASTSKLPNTIHFGIISQPSAPEAWCKVTSVFNHLPFEYI